MRIKMVQENKKNFLDLLLLADEQENMIDQYIDRGDMFALYDDDLKCVCIVTKEDENTCEIQNIATYEHEQRKGYGKALINHVLNHYKDKCSTMMVGTGDSPMTIPFYEGCGFKISHRLENYFVEHYDKPIIEDGVQLFHKIYLRLDF